MRRRQRNKSEGGGEGQERWLITYADMITLLLVFFIVLYSMSEVEKAKFNALVESLEGAFQVQTGSPPFIQVGKLNVPALEEKNSPLENRDLDELLEKLQAYIEEHNLETSLLLVNLQRGVQVTIKDSILYDLGSAELKPGAMPILNDVGELLKSVQNPISIEGHTDNQPIQTAAFPSNWELSVARSRSVLYYFKDQKNIAPERLSYTGYGEYQPVKPNDTKAHRATNRRVNIVVLRDGKYED